MKMSLVCVSLLCIVGCSQSQNTPGDCPFAIDVSEADCGTISVPSIREVAGSDEISIAFLVLKAKQDSGKEPIVFLQGGPGAGTIAGMAAFFSRNRLRNDRDIILVDQRGTGFSEAHCQDLGSKFIEMMAKDLSTQDEYEYMLRLSRGCKTELKAKGVKAQMYNTFENATDVDDLRKHLGHEKWIIMGGSYGTRLGLEYMRLFPEHVSSSVLLGLYPQQLSLYENIFTNFSNSLELVFQSCDEDPNCNKRYPNLKERFYKVKNELVKTPLSFTYNDASFYLNAQDMLLLVHQMLYHPALIGRIPEFVEALEKKEPGPIRSSLQITAGTMDLINGVMYWSIMSQEEHPFLDSSALARDLDKNRHLDPGPAFFISDLQIQEGWLSTHVDVAFKTPVKSEIPTLLINGRFDPVTPVSNAEHALEYLSKGQLVEFPNNSHSLMNACFFELVETFVNNPESTINPSCAEEDGGFRWR